MKVKVSEADGPTLNWMVAKCWYTDRRVELSEGKTGVKVLRDPTFDGSEFSHWFVFFPSTYWDQGGPIIERENLDLVSSSLGGWTAEKWVYDPDNGGGTATHFGFGPTPLIAAMRCFVASKLGDVVDVPEELL